MKAKKILSTLVAVATMLCSISISVFAAGDTPDTWDGEAVDTSWYNTTDKEFTIDSAAELAGLAKLVNDGTTKFSGCTVTLTTDIDLDQNEWAPIGRENDDRSFRGSFDGCNHTISNLWISSPGSNNVGLFGYAGVGGDEGLVSIKNLTINNATVAASSYNSVAAVVGNSRVCTVENVHLTGNVTISGNRYVGGIVGHGYATMSNCSAVAEGSIDANYWCCGALIGYLGEGNIKISDCVVEGTGKGLELWSKMAGIGGAVGMPAGGQTFSGISVSNTSVSATKGYESYGVGYIVGDYMVETDTAVQGCVYSNVSADLSGEAYIPSDATAASPAIAQIDTTIFSSLQDALDTAVAMEGAVTVEILSDIDLTGIDWNPVLVSAPYYPQVTVNGNNKKITNLNDMLFSGTWAGGSALIINDLTIADSTIVHDENDTVGNIGVGAFIGFPQASKTVALNNCHLLNSTVLGGHWTGGLIGYAAGYSGTDGPVFMTLNITDCSVTGSTIKGNGSAGGIIGHGAGSAWTEVNITDTAVSGNTITSTGSSTVKAGAVVGTIGVAGTATTTNGITKTGGIYVAASVDDNTVTSGGQTITTIYGRQGSAGGMLTVTGGTYDNYPIEDGVEYAAPTKYYVIQENSDGTYGIAVTNGTPDAEVTILEPLTLTPEEHKHSIYNGSLSTSTVKHPLEVVMNFKAIDTKDEAAASPFAKWKTDFYVTVSGLKNGSITADKCYLAGNYGTFGWIVIPLDGVEVKDGVSNPVVSLFDPNLTYENICDYVRDFTAAIHIDEAILEVNPDFKVSLALQMTNPTDANDVRTVGEVATYDVADLMGDDEEKYETELYRIRFGQTYQYNGKEVFQLVLMGAIDSLNYQKAGFYVQPEGGEETVCESNKAFRYVTLETDGSVNDVKVTPDMLKDNAKYIYYYSLAVDKDYDDTNIYCTPFVVNLDGNVLKAATKVIDDVYPVTPIESPEATEE